MIDIDVEYVPEFLKNPDHFFALIKDSTPWVRRERNGVSIPRSEHWCNYKNQSYTYGSGEGERTYEASPWTLPLTMVGELINSRFGIHFEGCFSNYYLDSSDHLYWHSDDDPGIDHSKPIAVVSLGAEREIWFQKIGDKGETKNKLLLKNGSLLFMPAGFQATHQHRIPKAGRVVGPRISLTFRSLL